jgi:TPR repeat protein
MKSLLRAGLCGLACILAPPPAALAESLYSGMEDVVAEARALTPETLPKVRAAAAAGDAKAQLRLAFVYAEGGAGVAADDAGAARLFESAAVGGEVFGQVIVATLFLEGKGVAQSGDKAMSWFRKAAEQGNPEAFYALGRLRITGAPGINADAIEAYKWLSLGVVSSSNEGKRRTFRTALETLQEKMDAAQLAVGNERVQDWLAAHPGLATGR